MNVRRGAWLTMTREEVARVRAISPVLDMRTVTTSQVLLGRCSVSCLMIRQAVLLHIILTIAII